MYRRRDVHETLDPTTTNCILWLIIFARTNPCWIGTLPSATDRRSGAWVRIMGTLKTTLVLWLGGVCDPWDSVAGLGSTMFLRCRRLSGPRCTKRPNFLLHIDTTRTVQGLLCLAQELRSVGRCWVFAMWSPQSVLGSYSEQLLADHHKLTSAKCADRTDIRPIPRVIRAASAITALPPCAHPW